MAQPPSLKQTAANLNEVTAREKRQAFFLLEEMDRTEGQG
jgi:hypothetical protein